eukprot:2537100-Rhodomonas_salina.4
MALPGLCACTALRELGLGGSFLPSVIYIRYSVSGTDFGYAPTTRWPVLARVRTPRCAVRYAAFAAGMCYRGCPAHATRSGTEVGMLVRQLTALDMSDNRLDNDRLTEVKTRSATLLCRARHCPTAPACLLGQ